MTLFTFLLKSPSNSVVVIQHEEYQHSETKEAKFSRHLFYFLHSGYSYCDKTKYLQ